MVVDQRARESPKCGEVSHRGRDGERMGRGAWLATEEERQREESEGRGREGDEEEFVREERSGGGRGGGGSEGGSYRKEKEKGGVMCDVYAQVVR